MNSPLPATLNNAYGSFSHPEKRQWHSSTRAEQGLARHEREWALTDKSTDHYKFLHIIEGN